MLGNTFPFLQALHKAQERQRRLARDKLLQRQNKRQQNEDHESTAFSMIRMMEHQDTLIHSAKTDQKNKQRAMVRVTVLTGDEPQLI